MSSRDHHRGRADPASRPRSRTRSRTRSPDTTDRTDRHRSRRHHHHRHHHDDHHDHRHRRHTDTHRDRHTQDGDQDRRHRHRHHHHSSSHRTPNTAQAAPQPRVLPYGSRELTKHDLTIFTPLFAMYLDIQKGLYLEDLPEDEVKGRWKSFIRKWNHGELAEGWYDPAMLERARSNLDDAPPPPPSPRPTAGPQSSSSTAPNQQTERHSERDRHNTDDDDEDNEDNDNEDDDYGPTLPQPDKSLSGPTIPTIQDLELRKEQAREDALAARQDSHSHYRSEVRSHRAELRHMQEEVAPRAEPGTHERRMEKRQEAAQANRAFAEARRGGSPGAAAVPDEDLMGSGENELEAMKKSREREQRKKNERELRREEIMRARAAEREERLQKYRAKEEETIGWLKTLAKQRFG